jgi:hypothetical protein
MRGYSYTGDDSYSSDNVSRLQALRQQAELDRQQTLAQQQAQGQQFVSQIKPVEYNIPTSKSPFETYSQPNYNYGDNTGLAQQLMTLRSQERQASMQKAPVINYNMYSLPEAQQQQPADQQMSLTEEQQARKQQEAQADAKRRQQYGQAASAAISLYQAYLAYQAAQAGAAAGAAGGAAAGGATGGTVAGGTAGGSTAGGTAGGAAGGGAGAGAAAGAAAAAAAMYVTHQNTRKKKAQKGGKDLSRDEFADASSPLVALGIRDSASGFERAWAKYTPWGRAGSEFWRFAMNKLARPSTKSLQYHRNKALLNADVLGFEQLNEQRIAREKSGATPFIRKDLDPDFIGYAPKLVDDGGSEGDNTIWVNNKFARTRDVKDLRPEDVVGQQVMFESFGDDWIGSFTHQQRLAIAKKALDDGMITEGRGMIDFKDPKYVEELYRYAEQIQKGEIDIANPEAQTPAQNNPQSQVVGEIGQVQRPTTTVGGASNLKGGYNSGANYDGQYADGRLLAIQQAQQAAREGQNYYRPAQQITDLQQQQAQPQQQQVAGYGTIGYQRPQQTEGGPQYLKGPTSSTPTTTAPTSQTYTMGDGAQISLEQLMARAQQMGISLYRPTGEIDKRLLADAGSLKRWRESGR